MNTVTINNKQLPAVEYRGQRVVTFAMIDEVHQRPEGTAKDAFNRNRDRFAENIDTYIID
ncbi:ORF6N domain-containing protein, partial [Salmonella enterica]